MRHPLLPAALLVAALIVPGAGQAAEVTEVIDAVDGEDPFDANIEVFYDFDYRNAKISRESAQAGRTTLVKELSFQQMKHTITPRLQVGIWHDLAIFADFPLVARDEKWGSFQTGVRGTQPEANDGVGYSTLAADRCRFGAPRPNFCDPNEPPSRTPRTLSGASNGYPVLDSDTVWDIFGTDQNAASGEYRSVRGGFGELLGFGDMSVGLAWAPLNQDRAATQPNWVLKFRYTIPTGRVMNPVETANADIPGGVGEGLHQFRFSTAFSRRFTVLEPYMDTHFAFGVPAANSVDGLKGQYQDANMYQGGVAVGTEIVPYENKDLEQRFAIDLRAAGVWHYKQRGYSEMTDMLNDLSLNDQYSTLSGHLGFFFAAARFVRFDIGIDLGTDTNHFVTGERTGRDQNDNGVLELDSDGDKIPDRDGPESNLYYNPVLDTPGRRLKVEQTFFLTAMAHLALTF